MGGQVSAVDPSSKKAGFDCEFIERPKELPFECPICLLVLREPYNTTCCDNSFCYECIKQIKESRSPVCPLCKQKFEINPRKSVQRALYQLKVYCTHKKDGCDWVGPLGQLDKHLNYEAVGDDLMKNGCGFQLLKCHKCNESIPRKEYPTHVSDLCEERPFCCEYCDDYSSTYSDITSSHWSQCPCHPVECTNKCGKSIKRKDLQEHIPVNAL